MKLFKASLEDVPRIMDCAREFTSILACPINEAHYAECWIGFIKSGAGAMFLLEDEGAVVGGIGGIRHPDLLSGEACAVELFWYVKPKYRRGTMPVRLLTEFERWAQEGGCRTVAMVHMQDSMPEALGAFYERHGYELYETMYRKQL